MKPLKIYYSNPYNSDEIEKSFLKKYLPKEYIQTREKPDLVIEYIHKKITETYKESPKKILLSGENLYYKYNLFKAIEYFSKKTKLNLNFLRSILPRKILNIKINYLRKKYLDHIIAISKTPKNREFVIVTNDITGKNILVLPYFLQLGYIKKSLPKLNKKNTMKFPKKFCCIILSNDSAFDRIDFVKKLSKYKKVDIYGRTKLTNADNSKLPDSWSENPKFYSQYKFVICFENSFEKEYITEKLPNVLLSDAIPIYRGAPNVGEYFNTKSFINYEDCNGSYEKMIEKIIELDRDDKRYLGFKKIKKLTKKNIEKIDKKERELKKFLRDFVWEITWIKKNMF